MNTSATASRGDEGREVLWALVIFAAITPMVLLVAPAVAEQLGVELGLNPAQIGSYFSVELGAFSLATIPSYYWIGRFDARKVAAVALVVFCVGNIVSALWMPQYHGLLALRAITALGGGTLMVLCMSAAAGCANRDRVYGFWVVGQLVMGAIGLAILPHMFGMVGIRAFYLLLAALGILASPLCRAFPPQTGVRTDDAGAATQGGDRVVVTLIVTLGVLAFYLAIGGVWTFAGNAAGEVGIGPEANGTILAIATTFGIIGALVASAVGGRISRPLMLIIGYLLLLLPLIWLSTKPAATGYTISLLSFKFSWTFVLPFILATVASCDKSGKLVASLTLIIGLGLSVGPLVAGNMLQAGMSLQSVFLSGFALALVSAGLILRAEGMRS